MSDASQMSLLFGAAPRTVEEVVHAFGENLVLRAGAGTGKTEQLTSLYVHLVAGATELGRPVSPERIVAVTFTEKAASEMRERIAHVLRHLAGREPGAPRPRIATVVEASLAGRGKALDSTLFSRALDALAGARITTLHAFSASLLRACSVDAGLDPTFSVLEDQEAQALFAEACVRAVRVRLEAGDVAVSALVRDVGGLGGGSGFGAVGLVPTLAALHAELAETGRAPDDLLSGTPYTDAGYDRELALVCRTLGVAPADARAGKVARAWDTLVGVHARLDIEPGVHANTAKVFARIAERARELAAHPSYGTDDLAALVDAAHALASLYGSTKSEEVRRVRAVSDAAVELFALPHRRARADAIVSLLADAGRRYEREKRRAHALDFADLTRRARDLLRDNPPLRRELSRERDALLVDELQDTNAVQRDLVYLLHAKESVGRGVPRYDQLDARGLFVVGDRKQSIYGFRNADVSVFEEIAEHVVANGGREVSLTRSFRSVEPLVHAMNHLAAASLRVEGDERETFEIAFDPESEALEPVHPHHTGAPCVELVVVEEGDVDAEASATAERVLSLVSDDACLVRDAGGRPRRASFGDVALLLPRFTHVHAYLRALDDVGVPYVVVKGRGLMQTVEARDVLALGRVLAGEDDGRGIAAVLRGPFVSLSDDALLALRVALPGQRGLRGLLEAPPALPPHVAAEERSRYDRAIALLARLARAVDRIGLARAMTIALEETGYAAVLAGLPSGTQRIANVDRIVGELALRERAGEDGRAVLHDLAGRSGDDADREADVATEGAHVVRVMTVHQSKGLQFPIVVAADLGRSLGGQKRPIEHDRHPSAGLAVAVRAPWGAWTYAPHHDEVTRIRLLRERAERMRLFYVQITRARDHLVLVGTRKARAKDSLLAAVIEPVAPVLEEERLLVRRAAAVVLGQGLPGAARAATSARATSEMLARLGARASSARPKIVALEVPVTQLEDFALCPRRFRARHLLRLPEHPEARTPDSPELDADLGVDPRRRGTLAHAVLEALDFGAAASEPARALARAMEVAGAPRSEALLGRLLPFVTGEYAAKLAALAPGRVAREVPFTLAVDAGDATLLLKGQIDLLVDDEETVDVVDYKVTSPRGPSPTAPYRFQLGAYAAAVRRTLDGAKLVRTAVQFLDGKARLPVFAHVPDVEPELAPLGRALLEARRDGRYEGRDEPECRRIGCGYVWLCHGG